MTPSELHKYFGTWRNVTTTLNFGTTSYALWLRKGCIPFPTQLLIEHKTQGALVAREKDAIPNKAEIPDEPKSGRPTKLRVKITKNDLRNKKRK